MTLTVAIHTVGCRANQADSAQVVSYLGAAGIEVTPIDESETIIINTCCVTNAAVRDCNKTIRKYLRDGKKVVVMGCAVSGVNHFADTYTENKHVYVAGGGKDDISTLGKKIANYFHVSAPADVRPNIYNVEGRSRGLIKIQTGCTHCCSYCIVPKARGKERSMPLQQILNTVQEMRANGILELVLTGVQMGAWGIDLPSDNDFSAMIKQVARAIYPGRVRLSSIEPWSITRKLVETVADTPNICNHLHIPLQSGDDGVLADMKRGYNRTYFANMAAMIREHIPDAALGTDVICGFPSEDDAAFAQTLELLEQIEPAYVHGFSYSPRDGTVATKKFGDGNRTVAKKRNRTLGELDSRLRHAFVLKHVGQRRQVFIEEANKGLTDTFLRVKVDGAHEGALANCLLGAPEGGTLHGDIVAAAMDADKTTTKGN